MPDIKVFPNHVSPEDIQTLLSYIEDNCENPELFKKQLGVAHKEGYAYRAIFPLEKDISLFDPKIIDIVLRYAKNFLEESKKYYGFDGELYLEAVSLTKLTPGIQLRIHQDYHGFEFPLYSGMLYLNDNFEGGEVVFLDEYTKKSSFDIYNDDDGGLIHSPAAGELVIFKSKTWHASRKVQGRPRYAIAFWSTINKTFSNI